MADVSVIIPTLAQSARARLIERAIESVLRQEAVQAQPIVVVNGRRHEPAVLEALKSRSDIRLLHLPEAGLAEARLKGREAVDTPFFAFLDDDDELLPRSLTARLAPMLADEAIDVVIANGIRESDRGRTVTDPDIERFQADPLAGLIESCWLNADGGVFRSKTVGPEFFGNLPPIMEWTYLGFRLAQSRKLQFMNMPAFINHDTPNSLGKSQFFNIEQAGVLEEMLRWPMPDAVRAKLKQKHVAALHQAAKVSLDRGDIGAAWRFHLRSLGSLYGQRYLPFTRHILRRQFVHR